jgi:drug/metabolite transporter (DMT)-like permease
LRKILSLEKHRSAGQLPTKSLDGTEKVNPARRDRVLAHLAMLAFVALIALGFSLTALIKDDITTVPLNASRFLFGTLLIGVAAFGVRRRLEWPKAAWRFGLLGLLSAIYFITMFICLTLAPPVATSAVFTLIPLMAAAFAFLLMRQSAKPLTLASLVIAALGSTWVIFRGDVGSILAFEMGRGEAIFFFGCVCYALYTVLLRRLNRGEPSLVASFWTLAATTLWVSLYGVRDLLATDWAALPAIVWWVVAYLAIFPTAVTFFLVQFAALRLPSAKVISYGYLTPAFVIVFEGIGGHGWPTLSVVVGAGVTVLGLVVLALAPD